MKKTTKTETTSTYEFTAAQIRSALKLARFAKLFIRRHGEDELNRDTKFLATLKETVTEECPEPSDS